MTKYYNIEKLTAPASQSLRNSSIFNFGFFWSTNKFMFNGLRPTKFSLSKERYLEFHCLECFLLLVLFATLILLRLIHPIAILGVYLIILALVDFKLIRTR